MDYEKNFSLAIYSTCFKVLNKGQNNTNSFMRIKQTANLNKNGNHKNG